MGSVGGVSYVERIVASPIVACTWERAELRKVACSADSRGTSASRGSRSLGRRHSVCCNGRTRARTRVDLESAALLRVSSRLTAFSRRARSSSNSRASSIDANALGSTRKQERSGRLTPQRLSAAQRGVPPDCPPTSRRRAYAPQEPSQGRRPIGASNALSLGCGLVHQRSARSRVWPPWMPSEAVAFARMDGKEGVH